MTDQSLPAVSFHRVTRRYGPVTAVSGVTLDIAKGEFFALLGSSGSGKTTLLMLLAGFDQPSEGKVLMSGTSVTEVPPHRRSIGVVFQNYALFPHMTAAENVAYPLKMRGVGRSERDERVKAALSLVNLTDRGASYPIQMSGGQQQRVALARSLVFGPDILLMDEPLGALDRRLRDQMQHELKRIQHELGITVIYVTHDQSEAMAMADRIGIMSGGELLQVADPETIYAAPSNHFVARFIGDCSILRVTNLDEGRGYEIAGGRQLLPSPAKTPFDIVVRPESVSIRSVAEANSDEGFAVPATIRDITYLGSGWRVALQISDGQSLLANVMRGDLLAGSLEPGKSVIARWAPASVAVLPTEG
ncbi:MULTISPECIES: polyamine ABC transporter ATP-binding protein [Rhizobium/Agrobacterium group]|uniref:Spermidine/putrescine import ATP-binding protein PotA n=2 Tax=Rhizobium/Agrobacterium group TaxID=227290 RepID=O69163_AGRTU|nr:MULTISPECIES: polyamine ABC transporter ATP-binding protein [Rhizobium/Agrobacterium group]AAK08604.1 ChtG [Agrobacterium tumefaciens]ARU12475.1 agropine transporter ATP-binding protein [Agrobacterium tumefaciens]MBB3947449.1 putative spermidine/putrescine transport system ATP-binding protein [Rhizobium skierniewicense]NSL21081.1 polyamine ABC transporter ATP-binding protein [Agrobacterium tumefaciens]NSY52193.1 polyamine ABC transporter ATP-binding protein [Agrobacterium tumefaciens]